MMSTPMDDEKRFQIEPSHNPQPEHLHFSKYKLQIRRIAELKDEIQRAKAIHQELNILVARSLAPLVMQVTEKKKAFLMLLDKAYDSEYFTFFERTQVRSLIMEKAFELSMKFGDDTGSKIYEKYHKSDPERILRELSGITESFVKDIYKIMTGTDQASPAPEIGTNKKFELHPDANLPLEEPETPAEGKVLTPEQMMRNVYIRLARHLHPDLEQDEAERVRKTELMQRISHAYQSGDLHFLLAAQEDLLKITGEESPDVAVFTEILKKQIRELQEELAALVSFGNQGMLYQQFVTNKKIDYVRLDDYQNDMKRELQGLKKDLETIMDKNKFRMYLLGLR